MVRLRDTGTPSVMYEEAKERVVGFLNESSDLRSPADLADVIWPDNRFQSPGFVASPLLRRMEKEGAIVYRWRTAIRGGQGSQYIVRTGGYTLPEEKGKRA